MLQVARDSCNGGTFSSGAIIEGPHGSLGALDADCEGWYMVHGVKMSGPLALVWGGTNPMIDAFQVQATVQQWLRIANSFLSLLCVYIQCIYITVLYAFNACIHTNTNVFRIDMYVTQYLSFTPFV